MKHGIIKKTFSAALSMALIASIAALGACGIRIAEEGADVQAGAQSAAYSSTVSSTVSSANTAESADASAFTAASTVSTQTELAASAFSSRDLSGEYDAQGAVLISLEGGTASASSESVTVSGSTITITAAGTYIISGTLDNGSIIVNAGKEDKVQLVLNGAKIHSEDYAAIYVFQADKVFISLADGTENSLSNGGSFTQRDEHNVDGVIYSRDDVTLNGGGALTIASPAENGIVSKDELVITGGSYSVTAGGHALQGKDSIAISDGSFTLSSGKDALHSENSDDDALGTIYVCGGSFNISAADDGIHATSLLQIDGGKFEIAAAEGLESTYILINGGDISVTSGDDGINASLKSSAYYHTVEINGGSITISMARGDTDGIDSNGNLIVTGGEINITGQSAFDCDGTITHTGGTITINGRQASQISSQMTGGRGGFGGGWR